MKIANIKNFIGVFPIDMIPDIKKNNSMVINLDSHDQPGSHWVGLFSNDNDVYYYDSYGLYPPPEVVKICKKSRLNCIYSSNEIQHENSILCGYYVCHFIIEMNKNLKPYDILYSFKNNNSKTNDYKVLNSLKKILL